MKYLKLYENFDKEQSLGEFINSLSDDEYVIELTNDFIKDIDQSLNLVNAVNLLDEQKKKQLKARIEYYLDNGFIDKDVETSTSVQITEKYGKNVFKSFLKVIKTRKFRKQSDSNFLTLYITDDEEIKNQIRLFKSLEKWYDKYPKSMYVGITLDGHLEYGFYTKGVLDKVGYFKLTNTNLKLLNKIEYIKEDISDLTYKDIVLYGKIKKDLLEYEPEHYNNKSGVLLYDNHLKITFSDLSELYDNKENFSKFVLSKKWGKKVLISVKSQDNLTFFKVKIS